MARIVLIDDDEHFRDALTRILERHGHTVASFHDGKDGLRVCRADPVDLVITDIFMPRKDGIEVVCDLRRDHPNTKVIAVSGGGLDNTVDCLRNAELLGATLTLAKPFRLEEILQAVTYVIAQ